MGKSIEFLLAVIVLYVVKPASPTGKGKHDWKGHHKIIIGYAAYIFSNSLNTRDKVTILGGIDV